MVVVVEREEEGSSSLFRGGLCCLPCQSFIASFTCCTAHCNTRQSNITLFLRERNECDLPRDRRRGTRPRDFAARDLGSST